MKKILLIAAVLVIVAVMASGAFAGSASSSQINVSGTVVGTCKINTDTTALAFTSIDPSSGNTAYPATKTGDTTAYCTKGNTYVVTALSQNAGGVATACAGAGITGRLDDGSGNFINYTLTCTDAIGQGFGPGNDVSLAPVATIDTTAYPNAVAGSYSDKLTLTVNF